MFAYRLDHWGNRRERHVLLCERCLVLADFDLERLTMRRLSVHEYCSFELIRVGPLECPRLCLGQ